MDYPHAFMLMCVVVFTLIMLWCVGYGAYRINMHMLTRDITIIVDGRPMTQCGTCYATYEPYMVHECGVYTHTHTRTVRNSRCANH